MKLKLGIAAALLGTSLVGVAQPQPAAPTSPAHTLPANATPAAPAAPIGSVQAQASLPTAPPVNPEVSVSGAQTSPPPLNTASTTVNSMAAANAAQASKIPAANCCDSPAVNPFSRKGAPPNMSEAVAGSTVASGVPSSLKSTPDSASGPATASALNKKASKRSEKKVEVKPKAEPKPIETWEEPVNVTVLGTVDGFYVMRSNSGYIFKSTKSLKIVKKPIQPGEGAVASNGPSGGANSNSAVTPPAVPAFGPNNTGLPSIVGRPNSSAGAQPFSLGNNQPSGSTPLPPTWGQRASGSSNSMPINNPGATGTRVVPGGAAVSNPTVASPAAGVAPVTPGSRTSGKSTPAGSAKGNSTTTW